MGTIHLSEGLAVNGKVGQYVFYVTKEGKQVIRSYTKPRNPRSPKQLDQRARFGLVSKELAPFKDIVQRLSQGRGHAYRSFIGKAYHEAIVGEYPDLEIDYSRFGIAEGPLPLPEELHLRLDSQSREATLCWNPGPVDHHASGRNDDKLSVVGFDAAETKEVRTLCGAPREAGNVTLSLPATWRPDSIHFWVYLSSRDLREISNCVYLPKEKQ